MIKFEDFQAPYIGCYSHRPIWSVYIGFGGTLYRIGPEVMPEGLPLDILDNWYSWSLYRD